MRKEKKKNLATLQLLFFCFDQPLGSCKYYMQGNSGGCCFERHPTRQRPWFRGDIFCEFTMAKFEALKETMKQAKEQYSGKTISRKKRNKSQKKGRKPK